MILKEKAEKWNKDADIQALLKQINQEDGGLSKITRKYTPEGAAKLLETGLDRKALTESPLPYEKLDQLTMEVLMGVR